LPENEGHRLRAFTKQQRRMSLGSRLIENVLKADDSPPLDYHPAGAL
jgi:hypothetical protein